MKIVVLTSGGIDSALMISMLTKEGHEILPMHINYGHLAEEKEWECCKKICNKYSLEPFRMDISGFGKLPSGLTNRELDVYEKAFLPTRNLTFITMGAAYAYSKSCDVVAIGLLSNPIFPDQTKDFVEKAQISISTALGSPIHILTPLIDLDKRDILKLAEDFGLSKITYFCHAGGDIPCGKCISCRERIAAENSMYS